MEEEEEDDNEGLEEEYRPTKRIRSETMVLDAEEAQIASNLQPIHTTSGTVQPLDEDEIGMLDFEDEKEGGAVGDISGEHGAAVFEDNGVYL